MLQLVFKNAFTEVMHNINDTIFSAMKILKFVENTLRFNASGITNGRR
jgi:hypothetical protein